MPSKKLHATKITVLIRFSLLCLLGVIWGASTASAKSAAAALPTAYTLSLSSPSTAASPSTAWESDYNVRKAAHYSLSAVGTESLLKIGQVFNDKHQITFLNRLISSSLMLGVGIGKELYDRKVTGLPFNSKDVGYDFLGILTGNILQYQF